MLVKTTVKWLIFIGVFLTIKKNINCKTFLKIVLLVENSQPEVAGWFGDAIKDFELRHNDLNITENTILLDRNNEKESYDKFCSIVFYGTSIVFDLTWRYWSDGKDLIDQWNIPYVKSQIGSTILLLKGMLDLLEERNATDVVVIFQSENDMDQFLYNIIGKSVFRIMVIAGLDDRQSQKIKNLRPIPGHFVLFGDSVFNQQSYKIALRNELVKLSDRWILVFTDFNYLRFDTSILQSSSSLLTIKFSTGCQIQNLDDTCSIEKDFQVHFLSISYLVNFALTNFIDFIKTKNYEPIKVNCNDDSNTTYNNNMKYEYEQILENNNKLENKSLLYWDKERQGFYLRTYYNLQVGNKTYLKDVANWYSGEKINIIPGSLIKSPRKFYRIGITEAIPWIYQKIDLQSGKPLFTTKGDPIYEGFCIDLIEKIAKDMDFDYELITPKIGTFGKKLPNGTWTGVIGDLVRGDTDMIVTALVTTSQREEVVDFVAPNFDQTGISIVIRKPVRQSSLFRFMTVLKIEVWFSILAAIAITSILLALLDKYSPYSIQNNKSLYPHATRYFTLKESFWFTLTSFTPQGGGETPKSYSGRTLVAAYWLFSALMLATFTANLAAFLTVEGMSGTISSLEQLARQSRINYTVVKEKMAHEYFINMKNAEDILYTTWKEITLNSTSDERIFHVWDYPIKEQYGHILLAINSSNPVASAKEGFEKVNEHIDGDFALIHDSSEIRYEVSRNCNITEVGERFGERPYAIAVQQGSKMQEDLAYEIMSLQNNHFLEGLTAKYWNYSVRGVCEDDETEGITLESLGGVFIATLFGLLIAMITLAWEIFYYRRKERKTKDTMQAKKESKTDFLTEAINKLEKKRKKDPKSNVTIGNTFKPVLKPKISLVNVEPKIAWNP